MAVPFVIPDDQNVEAEVELITTQLNHLLSRLQTLLRRTRMANQTQNNTRVRSSGRVRLREEPMPSTSSTNRAPPSNIPDLLSNLAMIAAATNDAVVAGSVHHSYPAPVGSPRRRNSSESSNCEETKISITAVVNHSVGHWNQEEDELSSPAPKFFSGDGFLSRIVPGPASAPLWTAMICFVGWHLFKAR